MDGREHVHTGVIAFLFAGLSAVIFIQLLRIGSAWLVDHGYDGAGSTVGALVTFK